MAKETEIAWTDSTFNPWEGCQKVGPGCDNCYAETRNARFGGGVAGNWGPGAPRRRTSVANWAKPLVWNKAHAGFFAEHGHRQRVFAQSLSDWADNAVPDEWRIDMAKVILATPNLDWLLLTKRIGNAAAMLAMMFPDGMPENIWIGATIVNQEEADRDIKKLLAVPAATRFLSMEPLLGPVDLGIMIIGLDWVIVGGESGAGARPIHPDWARSLRDQCQAAGVPFLFKQWGEFSLAYDRDRDDPDYQHCGKMDRKPGRWVNLKGGHGFNGERVHFAERVGKKHSGRLLDGALHDGFPA